jgi:two-component system, cell cycle response regulator DivK
MYADNNINKSGKKPEYDWADKLILVAEDQEINKIFFSKALTRTKVKLLWASDGELAVSLCKLYDNINLVLMDIRMPKLNGLQATREIKKIRKDLPIIAQTAYPEDDVKVDSFKAGCVDYIIKPIPVNTLLETIEKHFNSH